MGHDPSSWIQEYFQIRSGDDAGLNADSGWAADENTNATIGTGMPFRIRFKVRDTVAGDYPNLQVKCQVSRNSGAWTDLDVRDGVTVPAVLAVVSSQYADGAATSTELLTSTTTYIDGDGNEDNISTAIVANSKETEFEFCLMIMSFHDGHIQNVASDTLEFRLVESDGTVFAGTYTNPVITVAETDYYIGGCYPETPTKVGPYVDGNGNIYAVIEFSHNSPYNSLLIIKSADGGMTWREMDGSNRPTERDVEGVDVVQAGDKLHILHAKSSVYYHCFRTSDHATNPDSWETVDEAVDETIVAHGTEVCSLAVRSDDSLVAFYVDVPADAIIRYKIRDGTWGSQQTLDSGSGIDYISPVCVLGYDDETYVFYKDDTNSNLYYNTIDKSDVKGTRQTVATDLSYTTTADNQPMTEAIYYDSDGDEKVMIVYQKTAGPIYSRVVTNGGAPGSEATVSDNDVERDEGGNHMVIASLVVDGDTARVIYSQETTMDIWYTINDNEGGWNADVEIKDAVAATWVRANLVTHAAVNGGHTALGYIWQNGDGGSTGFIWYDEIFLRSGFPPVPARVHLDWRKPLVRM